MGKAFWTCVILPDSLNECNQTQGTARISCNPELVEAKYVLEALRSRGIQLKMEQPLKKLLWADYEKLRYLSQKLNYKGNLPKDISKWSSKKDKRNHHLKKTEELFQSLLQRAFKGELITEKQLQNE